MTENIENIKKIDNIINNSHLLIVSPDAIESTKAWLREMYSVIGIKSGENAEEKIQKIIDACILGWGNKTPATFEKRVMIKIGGNSYVKYKELTERKKELALLGFSKEEVDAQIKQYNELSPIKKRKKRVMSASDIYLESTIIDKANKNSLKNYLDKEEKEHWVQRELEYRKEFDFNSSSDKILLEEVLYNEVLLRRVRLAKMTGDPERQEAIKGLQEMTILDNHKKLLEKLGVLRVQRIETDTNIEGNVGEITVSLENKLTEIRNIVDTDVKKRTLRRILEKYSYITLEEIEDLIEEQSLLREVQTMGELNPIPIATYQQIENSLITKVNTPIESIDLDT